MNGIIRNVIESLCEVPSNLVHSQAIRRMLKRKSKKRYLLLKLISKRYVSINRNILKINNYIEIVHQYDEITFKSHFRMTKSSFQKLLLILDNAVQPCRRRPKVDTETALLMTIWTLGNLCSYHGIANRFGVSKGCAVGTVLFMCKQLTKLSKNYIKWPSSDESKLIIEKFNTLRGPLSFPNVIGCIDVLHIPIPSPSLDSVSYYNRKGFYSLILQGVCDSEMKFLDVFFGWPGGSHEASVWSSSSLCNKFEDGNVDLPTDCHLLGDSAYPLKKYLMVPYKDSEVLTAKQIAFNLKLSSTRTIIEKAFGMLMSQFRRLKYLHITKLLNSKYFVVAAIVLHNFILDENEEFIETTDYYTEVDIDKFLSETTDTTNNITDNAGKIKRIYLTDTLKKIKNKT